MGVIRDIAVRYAEKHGYVLVRPMQDMPRFRSFDEETPAVGTEIILYLKGEFFMKLNYENGLNLVGSYWMPVEELKTLLPAEEQMPR